MTELSIDFPEFKMTHLLRPTSAKIKQNHKVIWKGPVKFDGSIAKLDLKIIKGYEKHTLFTIEFYKKLTNEEWTDNIIGTLLIFIGKLYALYRQKQCYWHK